MHLGGRSRRSRDRPEARLRRWKSFSTHALSAQPWPGNVRELGNLMERLVVLSTRDRIGPDDLPASIRARGVIPPRAPQGFPSGSRLADFESARILEVLDACGGNKKLAAAELGIHRSTLYAKLERMK